MVNINLNKEQESVVIPQKGVLIVRAGAGSGKTHVITSRIAYLIKIYKIDPNQILALTFTNKAAKEMKERISKLLGEDYFLPQVGTFHSYCLRLLKQVNIDQFTLIDDADQNKIINKLINLLGLTKKISARQVLSSISRIKNTVISEAEKKMVLESNLLLKDLYFLYESEKAKSHSYDFDDLLIKTLALFNSAEFTTKFHRNIRHIVVDEYQDTNIIQHELLKKMTLAIKDKAIKPVFNLDSLCVVGDEDQSIYSWRGATINNILDFNKDYPETVNIMIEQNYRSVEPILKLANYVISHNSLRNKKNLWSEKQAFDRIRLISSGSSYQESEAIAIFLKIFQNKKDLKNCAILYRSHFQSRALEEALLRHSVPYKIIGGIQFYDRLEIKDLIAYLRLIVNPFDRFAFSRAINVPLRGLGEKFEELFYSNWDQHPFLDFKELSNYLIKNNILSKTRAESLNQFISIFENLNINKNSSDVLDQIIKRTGYFAYLKSSFEQEEYKIKHDNIKEFINSALYFEQTKEQPLNIFLEEISLLQDQMNNKYIEETDYVPLMTLHAAKGLEFNTVILPGLEEGILPSSQSNQDLTVLEEERRLLYVGITRAKERLLLSWTKSRYAYGKITDQRPSRFIDELDTDYYTPADINYFSVSAVKTYFEIWLKS